MDSSVNSLRIFYNQAAFYRRNQTEKQFIFDTINKEIVEIEKECKKIADSIVDSNNQPKDSIAKLNQNRRNLANLYVKQLLLEQEDTENPLVNIESKEEEEATDSEMSHHYSEPPIEDEHQRQASASFSSSSSKETILESPFMDSKTSNHEQLSYNPTEHEHVEWNVDHQSHPKHSKPSEEFTQVIYQQKLIKTVETIVDNALHEHHSEHTSSHHYETNNHSHKSGGYYYDDNSSHIDEHHHINGNRSPVSHLYEDNEARFDSHVLAHRRVSRDTEMDSIVEHEDEQLPPPMPKSSYTDMYSKYPEESHFEAETLQQQSIPAIILSTPPNAPPDSDEEGDPFVRNEIERDANISDIFERTITVDHPIMTESEAGSLTEITLDAVIIVSRKSVVEETVPLEHWATVNSETYEAIVERKPVPVYVEPEPQPEPEVIEYVQDVQAPEPRYSPEPEPEPHYSPEPESESEEEIEYEPEPAPAPRPIRSPSPEEKRTPSPRYHPQRVYNIYEDIEITETEEKLIKGRIVKKSGYDYFKKIEREEVKEEGIPDASTVRASTDYGWQAQSPPINGSPVDFRTSSPNDRQKFPFRHMGLDLSYDNQFICEAKTRSTLSGSIDTPPIYHKSNDSSQSDAFMYPKTSNSSIRTPSPTTDIPDNREQSYNYQSATDSNNKYLQRNKFVGSPAYTPLSPEEQPRILSPSQNIPSQRSGSHYESHRTSHHQNKVIEQQPVYSKIFTIPQTHQSDQVNIPEWEQRYNQEEEQRYREQPQKVYRSYAPQNKTLLFDENTDVDRNNELYKAKAFKAEREKVASSTRYDDVEENRNQKIEMTNVKRSYADSSSHHSNLHEDNYGRAREEKREDLSTSVEPKIEGRKYMVDNSRQRISSSHKQHQQPAERYTLRSYEVSTTQTHHHQQQHQQHEHQQPVVQQPYSHIETSHTVHSSTKGHPNLRVQVSENDQVHQAVTEAAQNKFINARIPHSPMITPPSTPITIEPETDAPAPKIARGIFKNLERSIAEEVRREQGSPFRREHDTLEAKRRLAEESLQHPGRRPKGGQTLFGNGHSQSETIEEILPSAQRKISSDTKPKTVTFAPEHQEHSYEVNYYHETSSKIIKKSEIVADNNKYSLHDNNFERASQNDNSEFHQQQQQHPDFQSLSSSQAGEQAVPYSEANTASAEYHHHQSPEYHSSSSSSTSRYSVEEPNTEDFRQSKVFNSIQESSKKRLEKEEPFQSDNFYQVSAKFDLVKSSPRPLPRKEQVFKERPFNFQFINPPIIQSFNQYSIMPELEDGIVDTPSSTLNNAESDVLRNWDPTELVNTLYSVDYAPRIEQKRSKFRNMEGHLEIPNDDITVPELEREWKKVYFRTKDSRLQWFATKYADEHPIGDILLSDADIIPNREDFTITVIPKQEVIIPKLVVKVPSNLFEKWRQAFLSHRESTFLDSYVQPSLPAIPHMSENILIIELGSCSIRAGILTHRPSLPQSFFPAIGCITKSGEIFVGMEALKPEIRHNGTLQHPIDAVDSSVERYQLNKPVLNACLKKIINDLEIRPSKFTVLLSISQNIPALFISELLKILLNENDFKAATIARQPSLILYSYDVTTGIVVDIGERLNVVPVIDEYLVENAIVSLPFGAQQIRNSLRENLKQRNNGLYAYQSPLEHTLLRYAVEQACFVSTDFEEEESKNSLESKKEVDMSAFKLAQNMENKFTVDESRFHAPEGLFKPKKWNLEVKGLHQLIHNAIQLSPIDSRRTLYRNIYLCGGTSLLHGMAERIENELSKLVPGNIHVHVHMSPWRYHAAYLGAQVIASGKLFSKCCATKENLSEYLKQLETSSYSNGN